MALLERHGIGNGKYKVGGSYDEYIALFSSNRGVGNIELQKTNADTAANFRAIESGDDGSVYLGSQGGANSLQKYDRDGDLIWESNYRSQINWIKYDPFTDSIWAFDSSYGIVNLDLDGDVLLDIPVVNSNIINMEVNEDYLIIAFLSSGSTNNLLIYRKDGTLAYNYNYAFLRAMALIDDNLLIAYSGTIARINYQGVTINTGAIRSSNNSATKGSIVKDFKGNIYFWSVTAATSQISDLYVFDNSLVEIRRSIRTASQITPETVGQQNNKDIPFTNISEMLSDGLRYPFIFSIDGGYITVRQYDEFLNTTNKVAMLASSPVNSNRAKTSAIDINNFFYVITNKTFYKIDVRKYIDIFR